MVGSDDTTIRSLVGVGNLRRLKWCQEEFCWLPKIGQRKSRWFRGHGMGVFL